MNKHCKFGNEFKNKNKTPLYGRRGIHTDTQDRIFQLERFLTGLDNKITQKRDVTSNSADVFYAVQTAVQKILDVVGILDPVMKTGKVHPVGSFMEGTKLGRPNEFDFVAESAFFQNIQTVSVHDECKNAGALHLIVSDAEVQTTLDHVITDKPHEREMFKYLSPVKFRTRFWQLVTAVTTHLSCKNLTIETKTGKLRLVHDVPQHLDMFKKGPNIELYMVWSPADDKDKLGISVDVTPAIRGLNSIPENSGVNLEKVQRCLEASGGNYTDVLLIPTVNLECKQGEMADIDSKLCWRLSFSLLETQIIRNMDSAHKRCLRVLKYMKSKQKDGVDQMRELGLNLDADQFSAITIALQHSQGDMSLLTTYRLKMVVLDHEESCTLKTKMSARCLLDILSILRIRVFQKFLPIYFIPTKNAWSRSPVILLETSIEKIANLFQDILKETHHSFDKNFEKFEEVQKYVTERDGI